MYFSYSIFKVISVKKNIVNLRVHLFMKSLRMSKKVKRRLKFISALYLKTSKIKPRNRRNQYKVYFKSEKIAV